MSLLPNVERELMRVARAPAGESRPLARVRSVRHARLSGAVLAAGVSVVALLIGAGFLIGLHGSGAGRGAAARHTPGPDGHHAFPDAPRPSPGHFTRRGTYVCRRVAGNRYLPGNAGCVSVLRADMTGGGAGDLVLLYAAPIGRRSAREFEPVAYTLELVRPDGEISRTRLPTEGNRPEFERAGNLNDVPGEELVLLLAHLSSGDDYGVVTLQRGRLVLADAQLSAGGDSAATGGFSCRLSAHPRIIARTMTLLGPAVDGRWRWSVESYAWHGSTLRGTGGHTFVRRGRPARAETIAGRGCGRAIGSGAG